MPRGPLAHARGEEDRGGAASPGSAVATSFVVFGQRRVITRLSKRTSAGGSPSTSITPMLKLPWRYVPSSIFASDRPFTDASIVVPAHVSSRRFVSLFRLIASDGFH